MYDSGILILYSSFHSIGKDPAAGGAELIFPTERMTSSVTERTSERVIEGGKEQVSACRAFGLRLADILY